MRFVLFCAAVCILTHNAASAAELSSQPALPDGARKISPSELARNATAGKAFSAPLDDAGFAMAHETPLPVEYSRQEICDVVILAARAYNLPIGFFMRLIYQESGFKPQTVSRAGAQGVAQFMPGTAAEMGLDDPFDPTQALPASAQFLHNLHQKFGNHGLAAAAYNAGPRRVTNWLSKRSSLPSETRAYVLNITGRKAEEWVGPKKSMANFVIPLDTKCQQMAAPIVAAQAARWSRPAARPRIVRVKLDAPAGPQPQDIVVVRPDPY
jgi:soluble lytic murein transglycosylase-like protein